MKKKFFALLLACVIGLSFTACKSADAKTGTDTNSGTPADTTAPADTGDAAAADDSWTYIQTNGKLIIGLDDTFAPMGFRDESNNLVGFDIDLAKAVCEQLGIKAEFQPIDWDSKDLELNGKKIDCIWNGLSITKERQESMSLTKAYLNNRIIIMTNDGVTISTKDDLKNYKLGTQADSSALEVIKADPIYSSIKDNLSEYKSYDDCILDMKAGRIDAMIVDEVYGMYKNSKQDKPFGISSVNFGEDFYAVGFRKTDKALTDKIQEAIESVIASGKASEISKTWFGQDIVVK